MDTILQTRNLTVGYHNEGLITGLNLSISRGEVVTLLGANGIGKSTLLKTITGEQSKISGEIIIDNRNIESYSQKELSKLIAIVTTDRVMSGGLKVRELVSLGRHPHTGFFGKLSDVDYAITTQAMKSVGIIHKADSFTSELSDGERQKAMIARAIAQQTPIIILDEPFSFLDTSSRIEILSLLITISRESNVGILLSSHDVSQAMRMSDRIMLLDRDRKLHCGTPQQIVETNTINQMFESDIVAYDKMQSDFVLK